MRTFSTTGVLAGAVALFISGMAGAQAQSIRVMDYMTEGTASEALQASLDTCSETTGLAVDRQAVPYAELVQRILLAASSQSLPDIMYIDNSDVAQLAAG